MKKIYLLFGLLAKSVLGWSQYAKSEPVYKKQKIKETEIQALFSSYLQDGNHSAVTGGTGTEKLSVYAPEIAITHKADSLNTYRVNAGIDIISSASTDNIDFIKSSASRRDIRSHLGLGYTHTWGASGVSTGISTGLSVESDYTSLPVGVSVAYTAPDASWDIQASLQCYFDDLRWGRINKHYLRPVKLIYPAELRFQEWYNTHNRSSYNLNFSYSRILNRRVRIAVMPELVYQKGLLSTPFHRVYFKGYILPRVEQLPPERWKIPVGLQANIFAAPRIIIRTFYRFYWDDIGITGHTLQLEVPVKVSPSFSVAPLLRYYRQSASRYFRPYQQHNTAADFYTSDYDLSKFHSIKAGLSLRYAPQAPFMKQFFFDEAGLHYAWYRRSDGLQAHMFSLLLDIKKHKRKGPE